ncbi:MotA/TolQ/ExbB proton channel family protein [Aurantiacibacter gangjinensis]|uniref:Biopolymer transport protein ExbB n=1 Tax=Aurantiacibacter gangjinensis TaxID=502682 RepID=A0A0G9MM16_9SPHN|nr:MotA/TolQ/ExbB proton channel family protein [Aurantiacibacter gangjinensis]APE27619.1 MotA/TolQ/ExbB proton channel family protein [Aurantiacibacter gangjinensis]KLE31649.1 flagellar motor protein MotA [Aurantiacibacter gangjinensis]
MLIDLLATGAAGAAEAPVNEFGFWEAMNQGGIVAWSILGIMVIMSVGSFYILFTKYFEQNKVMKEYRSGRAAFWRAGSLKEGATKFDKNSAWRQLVDDGIRAGDESAKMHDSLESHDWLHGTLQRSESSIMAKLNGGLPFLATVGATAPFVGLLGTVIGIYRALINIGMSGSASIDKVAGPVGEALIMTAIGLLVAVPAVFAYNYLMSRNRRIQAMLSGFSTDLQANITSDGAVKPSLMTANSTATAAKSAKAAPATAKPAAKPAASTTTTGTTTTGTTPPKR